MVRHDNHRHVTDEERREFLKALGLAGAVGATGVGLQEVREAAVTTNGAKLAADELAAAGSALRADLAGSMDASLIADQQAVLADTVGGLSVAAEQGAPAAEQREEFATVADAAQPVYDHLAATAFFEQTTEHLPAFDPDVLSTVVEAVVGSEALTGALGEHGLAEGAGVDLLAEVTANAERLSTHHWVATDEIPRSEIEFGEYIPPMTKAATFGVLSWLNDLDEHLWQKQILVTDQIYDDAVWHAQSMATGFQLVAEGAKDIGGGTERFSDAELGALLATGFAVEAIAQNLLPEDAYWITEEMRTPRA